MAYKSFRAVTSQLHFGRRNGPINKNECSLTALPSFPLITLQFHPIQNSSRPPSKKTPRKLPNNSLNPACISSYNPKQGVLRVARVPSSLTPGRKLSYQIESTQPTQQISSPQSDLGGPVASVPTIRDFLDRLASRRGGAGARAISASPVSPRARVSSLERARLCY